MRQMREISDGETATIVEQGASLTAELGLLEQVAAEALEKFGNRVALVRVVVSVQVMLAVDVIRCEDPAPLDGDRR